MSGPPTDLHAALRQHFGFPDFRPGQRPALEHVLAGRDTLVVMPTGAGKSLIYQLAALLLPGTALVVSPLVALMKDQIDGLARREIPATFVNSSLSAAEQGRRLRALAEGYYKMVLVAPERLRSHAFRRALAGLSLSLLAVDEAHCLSQWGHDFRPDYLQIAGARRQFKAPVTLALTATATPRVQEDIIRLLGLPGAERLVTGFNRPNLTFEVFPVARRNAKLNLLREFLDETEGAGIVYVGTRRDAEEVAEYVRVVLKKPARHYHGALDPGERALAQDAFLSGDLPVMVATNAFGMGIDRPDVRWVLHYSLPGTLEAYYQEAGRAGRDGLPARVVLFYAPADISLHEFFIENDSPSVDELRAVHQFLHGLPALPPGDRAGPRIGFRAEEMERSTGISETKARVALDQLESAGGLHRDPDGPGGMLQITPLPLAESALRRVAAGVAARREHKRAQLEKMVAYAQSDACRRRILLDHFGDAGDAAAPLCCDNCLSAPEPASAPAVPGDVAALSQSERAALIVLDTIAKLGWPVGKSKLAQILKGGTGQEVARYTRARNYGKFAALRLREIEALLDQLAESGHIRSAGGLRPILQLTPRGEADLRARAAINVALRPVRPGEAQRLRVEREAGGTVALSAQLLREGLSPEEIAAQRGLTTSTIYSHLARLIASGELTVDAVVPAERGGQIRAAIQQVGSLEFLSPIKAALPEEIDYGMIRCVVESVRREQSGAPPAPSTPAPASPELFERLRAWRLEKARADHAPPFVIFSDETLRDIAAARPRSLAELLAVRGVGPAKVEKYGAEVLAIVGGVR